MNASCNSTLNRTCETPFQLAPWYSNAYSITMVVLYALIITAAIVGNILVCTAVCINTNLRKNVASYFVVSLALSDIGTASFSMPFDLESFLTFGRWYHSEALCVIWTTAYLITVPTSMWNLFALSLTRYKKLKNPWDRFRASPFITSKRAIIAISSLWIYCLALALIPTMGLKYKPQTVINGYCFFNISLIYSIVFSVLNFYLPMFAMCFIYHEVYKIARTQYLLPAGLETKPNLSAPETTSQLSVNAQLNNELKQQEKDLPKDSISTITVNFKNVHESGFCNQGLGLDSSDKERTGMMAEDHIKDRATASTFYRDNDDLESKSTNMKTKANDSRSRKFIDEESNEEMLENTNENVNNREKEVNKITPTKDDLTNTSNFDHQSSSIEQNTNSLCEVEINHGCYLTRQTMFKLEKSSAERSLDPMNHDVIQDTTSDTPSKLENKSPELADAIITPSTSTDTRKYKQNQIAVCPLDDCTADVSNHVTTQDTGPAVSQCQSQCGELVQDSSLTIQSILQEGRNRVSTTTQDNLGASMNALAMDSHLTKRRKVFVKNKKAARTIAVIVGAFLLCWMPYTTLSMILNICQKECHRKSLFHTSQVLLLLGYLNSAMNPIIFSYQDEQFLKSYRRILKTLFPCLRNVMAPN